MGNYNIHTTHQESDSCYKRIQSSRSSSYFVGEEDLNDPTDYRSLDLIDFLILKENIVIEEKQSQMDYKKYPHPPTTAPPGTSKASTPANKKQNQVESGSTSPKMKCDVEKCEIHKHPNHLLFSDDEKVVTEYKTILEELLKEKEDREKSKLKKIEEELSSFLELKDKLLEQRDKELENISIKFDNDLSSLKENMKQSIRSIHNS